MVVILSVLSVLCLFLSFALYKQLKNSTQNPELSQVYKDLQNELQNQLINFAKLESENNNLKNQIIEKINKINELEETVKNKDKIILELQSQNKYLEGENDRLREENSEKDILGEQKNALEIENKKITVELEEKKKNIEGFVEEINKKNDKINNLEQIIQSNNIKIKEIEKQNERNDVLLKQKEENIKKLTELQEDIKNQFKVISSEIIKEQKENFNKEQNESLGHLLVPLNKDIKEFKEKIQQVQDINNVNTTKIEENIKNLLDTTKDIGNKADNLATALKGDKKAQGNWGEFQLQNLLEMSGLEENISFFKQYNIKNIDGKDFFLDFLIKLPENRILIVDSKVSMANYDKYIACNNQNDKNICLKAYCEDIKNHIRGLGEKEYQKIYKEYNKKLSKDTPDFVFMFVAVEGAYIDAIKFDKTIFEVATKNKVAIVTTSSFMPVLRMIEHLWNIENQNKYISEIIKLSQTLYEKMAKFSKDILIIGESLDKAKQSYESAKNYISTGRGNMLSISDKIITIVNKKNIKTNLAIEFEKDEDVELVENLEETEQLL